LAIGGSAGDYSHSCKITQSLYSFFVTRFYYFGTPRNYCYGHAYLCRDSIDAFGSVRLRAGAPKTSCRPRIDPIFTATKTRRFAGYLQARDPTLDSTAVHPRRTATVNIVRGVLSPGWRTRHAPYPSPLLGSCRMATLGVDGNVQLSIGAGQARVKPPLAPMTGLKTMVCCPLHSDDANSPRTDVNEAAAGRGRDLRQEKSKTPFGSLRRAELTALSRRAVVTSPA
jgi:hypothetical protein